MYRGFELGQMFFEINFFVESEQSLYSIGIVPVLHVYIGTIAVQNSHYSSAKVALFSEIANVACTILNTPRTSPYTPQRNPYVARNYLYMLRTKSYVAYSLKNTIHTYCAMRQYDMREGEDFFQAKIFCKAFLYVSYTLLSVMRQVPVPSVLCHITSG